MLPGADASGSQEQADWDDSAEVLVKPTLSLRHRVSAWMALSGATMVMESVNAAASVLSCCLFIASTYGHNFDENEVYLLSYFSLDFLFRLFLAKNRWRYITSATAAVDIITILPGIVELGLGSGVNLNFIRFIRVVRVLRLLRVMRGFGTSADSFVLHQVLSVVVLIVTLLFIASGSLQVCEGELGDQPELKFHDWVYFVIVLASGVGFGDVVVEQVWSKLSMFLLFALVLGILAFEINRVSMQIREENQYTLMAYDPPEGQEHVVICGHLDTTNMQRFFREFFHEDHEFHNTHVIVFGRASVMEDAQTILSNKPFARQVFCLQGSIQNEKDLSRCAIMQARSIFVMSNLSGATSMQADGITMTEVMVLRQFIVARLPTTGTFPTLIIQLQHPENVEHLYGMGGVFQEDVVICTHVLRHQILAKAAECPGFGALVHDLVTSSHRPRIPENYLEESGDLSNSSLVTHCHENELYKATLHPSFSGVPFAQACSAFYKEFGLLLIGIEIIDDLGHNRVLLNPGYASIPQNCSVTGLLLAKNQSEANVVSSAQFDLANKTIKAFGTTPNRRKSTSMLSKALNVVSYNFWTGGKKHSANKPVNVTAAPQHKTASIKSSNSSLLVRESPYPARSRSSSRGNIHAQDITDDAFAGVSDPSSSVEVTHGNNLSRLGPALGSTVSSQGQTQMEESKDREILIPGAVPPNADEEGDDDQSPTSMPITERICMPESLTPPPSPPAFTPSSSFEGTTFPFPHSEDEAREHGGPTTKRIFAKEGDSASAWNDLIRQKRLFAKSPYGRGEGESPAGRMSEVWHHINHAGKISETLQGKSYSLSITADGIWEYSFPVSLQFVTRESVPDLVDHIIFCGNSKNLFKFVAPLRSWHHKRIKPVVILCESEPVRWRQIGVLPLVFWVKGSAMQPRDLVRAGISQASAVVSMWSPCSSSSVSVESPDTSSILIHNCIKGTAARCGSDALMTTEFSSDDSVAFISQTRVKDPAYSRPFSSGEGILLSFYDTLMTQCFFQSELIPILERMTRIGGDCVVSGSLVQSSSLLQAFVPSNCWGECYGTYLERLIDSECIVPLGLYRRDDPHPKFTLLNPAPQTKIQPGDAVFFLEIPPGPESTEITDITSLFHQQLQELISKSSAQESEEAQDRDLVAHLRQLREAVKDAKEQFLEWESSFVTELETVRSRNYDDVMSTIHSDGDSHRATGLRAVSFSSNRSSRSNSIRNLEAIPNGHRRPNKGIRTAKSFREKLAPGSPKPLGPKKAQSAMFSAFFQGRANS